MQNISCFSSPQPFQSHLVGSSWCTCEESGWRCHRCHRRGGDGGARSCRDSCPGRIGCERAHTGSSHRTAFLSPSLAKHENFPARAKKTHLPTHTVLTMKTLIIFHSPIKGMIHLGEWAWRITQDEHHDATARPFWGSPPEKKGCMEHVGTQDGARGWQQEGPSVAPIPP